VGYGRHDEREGVKKTQVRKKSKSGKKKKKYKKKKS